MSDDVRPDSNQPDRDSPENDAIEAEQAQEAAANDTFEQASNNQPEPVAEDADAAGGNTPETGEEIESTDAHEPAKLERLQKILAQAGVASRRHAEELITQGRVQVNGKVVTELGTKADATHDHIRVDGKLLQGSERLRYYMLNKPKGFVTTVSDPEGRPTVMQFFAKSRERLYPVGRLDYLSEGLLLVTNDGDLANKLTRAAAGVEKTYLVKVSGEPTEEQLDRLRAGVGIERGKPGSGRVQTAPAQIRKVRHGDNPWYEVVIIEGRNRELRKMFEEIGHHVEKIRRVGYGPLVLDIEPGKMRELEPEELEDLRKAADGKSRKPNLKDIRRRKAMDAQLPTVKPRLVRPQAAPPAAGRPAFSPRREFPPKKQFGTGRPSRPARPGGEGFRPRPERTETGPVRFGTHRPDAQRSAPPPRSGAQRSGPPQFGAGRPAWKKDDRGARPPARFGERPPRSDRRPAQFGSAPVREDRPGSGFAGRSRSGEGRPLEKKSWKRPDSGRPPFKPHARPQRDAAPSGKDFKPPKPPRLQIEAVEPERETSSSGRPRPERPRFDRPSFNRPGAARPTSGTGRTGARNFDPGRPPRGERDRSRPFTTGSAAARPGNKRSGPSPTGKSEWKPKPGGAGRPSSGGRSKPAFGARPGGRKPAAGRPSGPRPSGKRPGGKHGGKNRG